MDARVQAPVEEYLQTSFEGPDPEYVDGEIVERAVPHFLHGTLQSRFIDSPCPSPLTMAPMVMGNIVAVLLAERDKLDRAIAALGGGGRRGRRPAVEDREGGACPLRLAGGIEADEGLLGSAAKAETG